MGTQRESLSLSSALFGKARRAVLGLLYARPGESFYVRQIVRAAGAGQGAVQRELKRLAEAGVIRRRVHGRQVYYQANSECPVFAELRGLMTKTAGLADVVRTALAPLAARIKVAFVFGSVASGEDRSGSDVDLLVVGEATFAEVVAAVSPAQDRLGREVNPSVYPEAEFRRKLAAGHHFLETVLRGPKIFLVGDEGELGRLAAKRLARRASHESPGNRQPARRG